MTVVRSPWSVVSKVVLCLALSAMLVAFSFIGAVLSALCASAEAQQPKKVHRIGSLDAGSPSTRQQLWERFWQGLRELGYREGENISFEARWAEGKNDRLPALAAELVAMKVDVIVTAATSASLAAKQATTTIPIVMASGSDPVRAGLVASLAQPGGNITGLTTINVEVGGKRVELLKEAVPKLSRLAMLWQPGGPGNELQLREVEVASRALGLQLQPVGARVPNDFDAAFSAMSKQGAHAVVVAGNPMFFSERTQIAKLAAKSRLPTMFVNESYVDAGGLMAYGTNLADLFHRAAFYVDKILKGAKPAVLPVEQPMKFELVINLKTAKQIGLTIPSTVLYQADKVIK